MDNHPPTPLEILEERRLWRWWLRRFIKREPRFNLQGICAIITEYLDWAKHLAWANLLAVDGYLKRLTQLLESFVPIPKFCNGLTGVSLTDPVPALANN